jgi:hypothetical protein
LSSLAEARNRFFAFLGTEYCPSFSTRSSLVSRKLSYQSSRIRLLPPYLDQLSSNISLRGLP